MTTSARLFKDTVCKGTNRKFSIKLPPSQTGPVCKTDRLNVRLSATEIRFAKLKEGKRLMLFILKANSKVTLPSSFLN